MDISLFLAKVWGLSIAIICLGLLVNRKYFTLTYKKLEHDDTVLLLAGIVVLAVGVSQVIGYEVWQTNYKGILTILGWATLVKGALILLAPGYTEKMVKLSIKNNKLSLFFTIGLLLGLYLLVVGFTA